MKVRTLGNFFILLGLLLLLTIFCPLFFQEAIYLKNKFFRLEYTLESPKIAQSNLRVITPVDTDFGLVITKLNLNTRVFANIDAYNERQYQSVLSKGVAHAKGSALPADEAGYIFLFAHSADTPLNIFRYHAVFYLLGKLASGDEIVIFYQNEKYSYQVIEKKIVSGPEALSYINKKTAEKFLVLQTCYPAGTTLKRLIIIAQQEDKDL